MHSPQSPVAPESLSKKPDANTGKELSAVVRAKQLAAWLQLRFAIRWNQLTEGL